MIIQLETAAGAAMKNFDRAIGMYVCVFACMEFMHQTCLCFS